VRRAIFLALVAFAAVAVDARGETGMPPWTDADDVPLPQSAQSVVPKRGDMTIVGSPSNVGERRGVSMLEARLPLFGAKRGPGCTSRWFLVGPGAWVCGDTVDTSPDEPLSIGLYAGADGLPYEYFFTGRDGAFAYARPDTASEMAPDRELESGWAVAVTEQRSVYGERWGKTNHGLWILMKDLFPARPSLFHGEEPANGIIDFAWVRPDRAAVFSAPGGGATGSHVRFDKVGWLEEKPPFVRVSATEWMLARDLSHPSLSDPPDEVGGKQTNERWVDVQLSSQTLVAYDGTRPVYATLVSSGRGPPDSITPVGVNRIWVKLATATMDNVERGDVGKHYSMEDVPWVMYFDKSVALHGAFWHRDFGRVKSHGCVNLSPLDARWIFGWTSPRLPPGWNAAYPSSFEKGTAVRVR
jgi:hypothetical protein